MSWYVETLLKNRAKIRSNIVTKENYMCPTGYSLDYEEPPVFEHYIIREAVFVALEDDDYNNLLFIEKVLENLLKSRFLSKKEKVVINSILNDNSFSDIYKLTGYTRITAAKLFSEVCDRIAFLLGDIFTDEGYLAYMEEKYNLTHEQVEKARLFMASNKKHSNSARGIDGKR